MDMAKLIMTSFHLDRYANSTVRWIDEFAKNFGADGVAELNKVASNHTIVLEPADGTIVGKIGTDIVDGFLRIIFERKYIGYNIAQSLEKLDQAVNQAGASEGGAGLSFDARSSLSVYEEKIPAVKARLETITGASSLTINPNFEKIYTKLITYESAGNQLPRDWQKKFGL